MESKLAGLLSRGPLHITQRKSPAERRRGEASISLAHSLLFFFFFSSHMLLFLPFYLRSFFQVLQINKALFLHSLAVSRLKRQRERALCALTQAMISDVYSCILYVNCPGHKYGFTVISNLHSRREDCLRSSCCTVGLALASWFVWSYCTC